MSLNALFTFKGAMAHQLPVLRKSSTIIVEYNNCKVNCPYSKLLEVSCAEMDLTKQLNEFMLLNYTNFCQG